MYCFSVDLWSVEALHCVCGWAWRHRAILCPLVFVNDCFDWSGFQTCRLESRLQSLKRDFSTHRNVWQEFEKSHRIVLGWDQPSYRSLCSTSGPFLLSASGALQSSWQPETLVHFHSALGDSRTCGKPLCWVVWEFLLSSRSQLLAYSCLIGNCLWGFCCGLG